MQWIVYICTNSVEISINCVIVHNCLLILSRDPLSLIRRCVNVAILSAIYALWDVYQDLNTVY